MFKPKQIIKIGDRVIILESIETFVDTFTSGHAFNVIGEGDRGFDLQDDEGRKILECGPFVKLKKIEPLPQSSTNSPVGSQHWYNTLLSQVKHIGEFLADGDLDNYELLRTYGKELVKKAQELIDNYNKINK